MSVSYSNTVARNSLETESIEVSGATYLILLDAQKALGFGSMGDLVKHLFISTRADSWLEFPELLPVCEKEGVTYDFLLDYITNH